MDNRLLRFLDDASIPAGSKFRLANGDVITKPLSTQRDIFEQQMAKRFGKNWREQK